MGGGIGLPPLIWLAEKLHQAGHKVIAFCGSRTADLLPLASGASLVIAEGTARPNTEEPFATRGHLTPEEAGLLARDAGSELLLLTHLWAENDPFQALHEAESVFGGPVVLATRGTRLTVPRRH